MLLSVQLQLAERADRRRRIRHRARLQSHRAQPGLRPYRCQQHYRFDSDQGKWTALTDHLAYNDSLWPYVDGIAIDPSDSNRLYARHWGITRSRGGAMPPSCDPPDAAQPGNAPICLSKWEATRMAAAVVLDQDGSVVAFSFLLLPPATAPRTASPAPCASIEAAGSRRRRSGGRCARRPSEG